MSLRVLAKAKKLLRGGLCHAPLSRPEICRFNLSSPFSITQITWALIGQLSPHLSLTSIAHRQVK